jgi:guanine deaminase
MASLIRGGLLQARGPGDLQALDDAVVAVDDAGAITAVEDAGSPAGRALLDAASAADGSGPTVAVERLASGAWLLPGLVDLHVHAPQWPQLGTGLDLPLERWLFEYTFPLEARCADATYAASVWERMVPTLLRHGTTTAVYYATVHEEATLALAETCLHHGQRALVGRVGMDDPDGTPPWYRDASAAAGVAASARSVEAIHALASRASRAGSPSIVDPIVTPRFVPACTDALLAGLGELAAATGTRVQTHCSESDWEHGEAKRRFGTTDLRALRSFGLVTPHGVLAHANHMDDADLGLAAELHAGVAHCPLSNAYFSNAVFPVRRALERGVRVGLGTDVSGGAAPAVLSQCGMAVTASRMLEDGVDARRPPGERGVAASRIDTLTAFWLATLGGATAVGLPVGLLEPGRRFDAVAVDTTVAGSPLSRVEDLDDPVRLLEKIVRLAGPTDIGAVWVDGRRVG